MPGKTEITSDLTKQEQSLQNLTDEIAKMSNKISEIDHDLRILKGFPDLMKQGITYNTVDPANIISFPQKGSSAHHLQAAQRNRRPSPLLAAPGKHLPLGIPDHRALLQRDGLILLAWDKRTTERGEHCTAYWVTSTGVPRFFASKPLTPEIFSSARPDHKSYAAEDGIEFYGQKAPDYIVHVAPELMMSNPRHAELRQAHIKKLKDQGSKVDFSYKYLLTAEKGRHLPAHEPKDHHSHQTGA